MAHDLPIGRKATELQQLCPGACRPARQSPLGSVTTGIPIYISVVCASSASEATCTPLLLFYLSRRWLMAREQHLSLLKSWKVSSSNRNEVSGRACFC